MIWAILKIVEILSRVEKIGLSIFFGCMLWREERIK